MLCLMAAFGVHIHHENTILFLLMFMDGKLVITAGMWQFQHAHGCSFVKLWDYAPLPRSFASMSTCVGMRQMHVRLVCLQL